MDSVNKVSSESFFISHTNKEPVQPNGRFQDVLKALVSHADNQIKDANQKAEEFAVGKSYNLHEIMIASEKASLSFKFLLQIRNKLLDAYQEIMRMTF
jgi:flagellar hook-basal body complex protein FliE